MSKNLVNEFACYNIMSFFEKNVVFKIRKVYNCYSYKRDTTEKVRRKCMKKSLQKTLLST